MEPTYRSFIADKSYAKARTVIPANLAQPLYALAQAVGAHPWLDYHYSYIFGNYRIKERRDDCDYNVNDLEVASCFCGDSAEINFIKVHAIINQYSPMQIDSIEKIIAGLEQSDPELVKVGLQQNMDCMQKMNKKRQLMWSTSDPKKYPVNRIFLMGITGNEHIFGDGVVFEGVDDQLKDFRGETGAQDDIIPTQDILTGVNKHYPDNDLTRYLKELRKYRPASVLEFLKKLQSDTDNLAERIYDIAGSDSIATLIGIVNQIYNFRNGHWQFVQKYIMSGTTYNVATGGTPVTMWLLNQIESCLSRVDELHSLLEQENPSWLPESQAQLQAKKNLLSVQRNALKEAMNQRFNTTTDIGVLLESSAKFQLADN